MKLSMLKILCSSLLIGISCSSAFAGTKDGGGGMAVIFPDGKVRFADFLTPEELPAQPMSSSEINQRFFPERNRIPHAFKQGVPGKPDMDIEEEGRRHDEGILVLGRWYDEWVDDFNPFWTPAKLTLNRLFKKMERDLHELPAQILENFEHSWQANNIFPLMIRLHLKESRRALYLSPSLPDQIQEPLAVYINGALFISHPLVEALSPEDKKGFAIHEALRQLNILRILKEPLTTPEIEVLTRYLSKRSRKSDNYAPALAKLKNLQREITRFSRNSNNFADWSARVWHEVYLADRDHHYRGVRMSVHRMNETDLFDLLRSISSRFQPLGNKTSPYLEPRERRFIDALLNEEWKGIEGFSSPDDLPNFVGG